MTTHSKVGASSMHRWSVCPGSVKLSEGIANVSSSYAEEGTKAHELAAAILSKGELPFDADPEMLEAVMVYVNAVTELWGPKDTKLVEQGFHLKDIHEGAFGTADCVLYKPELKRLYVFDYKHGQGIPVDVVGNQQLMYYGLGALLANPQFRVLDVELVIVQPRCSHPDGPVRSWRISAIDLLDFSVDLLEAIRRTEDPSAELVPGDHCRFCLAANKCPQLKETALSVAKREFSPLLSYDPKELSETLHKLPILEAFIKQVREFAYGEAQHGRTPPGWKFVEKRATRKWKLPEQEVAEEIRSRFKLPTHVIYDEPVLKSVAQVEKLVSKKHMVKLSDLISSESSGFTLAPESDARPEVRKDAAAEFTKVAVSEFTKVAVSEFTKVEVEENIFA